MNDYEIKDIEGKTHIAFEKTKADEKGEIGDKPEDFEIIKNLGKGTFGNVFKVISKINKKVYAMKIIDLKRLKEKGKDASRLASNESKYLTMLSHPHIIKYYTNFTVKGKLYLIIENAENGDMKNFIDAHKKTGRPIPEDELWSIFLQCMQGLTYIHKMGVIHRDIKPGNILMDNNMTIKLGDFGTCAVKRSGEDKDENTQYKNARYGLLNDEEMQYHGTIIGSRGYMAKEMEQNRTYREYDQKIDVYSMGVSFYEMCFLKNPKESLSYDNMNYSKEMLEIINEMMEEDKDKRKPSEYFLEKIQQEFSKKYNRNTSIDAIVRCLHSFDEITSYYLNLNLNFTEEQIESKPITWAYILCLQNITGENSNIDVYFNSIKNFREILCIENTKFNKTKEINPKLVLGFLITRLHKEMKINYSLNNKLNNYFIKSGEEESMTSKVEMLLNFEYKFFSQLNSFISQKMMGLMKKTDICYECQMKTYSFIGYFFVTLDLEKIAKFMDPDIENYFDYQNKKYINERKYCSKCLRQTKHKEYKQFFTVPNYLIAIIDRGINNHYRISIKLKQKLDLFKLTEIQGKKYKLVGFICRNYENERYVSFTEVKNKKMWIRCEGTRIKEYNPKVHSDIFDDIKGELMMAFYEVTNS